MKVSKAQYKVLKALKPEGRIIRTRDYFYGQEVYCEHSEEILFYFRKDTLEALLRMSALYPAEMIVAPRLFVIDPYFIFYK